MGDFRRRSTMQPPGDVLGNARSNLPMPSSIMKPKAGRMSMSGPALRGPMLPPPVPSTIQRNNMYRSQNANALQMSVSKGRTPQPSVRRGSMWHGAIPGAGPSGSQATKDPRNLRDGPTQAKMRRDIIEWLHRTDLDVPNNILQSLTARQFGEIYQHLVLLVDPAWPFKEGARLEEQFIQPLQALRYPFVGSIDIRWLAAPAAPHSWPSLLAVLHWLVELGKARLHYMESEDPTLQEPSLVPDEFDDIHYHQALAMDYYLAAYEVFLSGQDVYPEQDKALEERYAKKDEKVVSDLNQQKERLGELMAELKQLEKSPPPIEQLKTSNGYLKHDKAKFEEVIRQLEDRKQRLIDTIAHEKAEISLAMSNLERLKHEHERLTDIVKAQNLTQEEVHRMTSEHESLTRDLEHLKAKISETNKAVTKLEVSLTRKVEDADDAVDTYNNLLSALNLFPPLPPPLPDINLTLKLNSAASNPQEMLVGSDVREEIKPALLKIAELKRNERATLENEQITVDADLDQLTADCENLESEVVEVQKMTNALSDQADDLREAVQREAVKSSEEAQRLEEELNKARTSAMANGVGVKSRLQALDIAYREQIAKAERLRDDTVRAIVKSSSEIVAFKDEVSRQLKYLHDFADAN
ncbi:unnamed protein product [Somion occarium]|uniref:Kinetochore protein NDC80 n=1 Tax=Somion occarium TaxID=3059160 RepID=A0ABP1D8E8_9APHY